MYPLVDDLQELKPICIWVEKLLCFASRLDGYTRSALATAMRTEIAKILRLRNCTPHNFYENHVGVGDGYFTVIAIGDYVYFTYHVGEPLDPVPPRPNLRAPNKIIGWLHQVLSATRKPTWQEMLGFELRLADSTSCLH
jgi:hypothetical protein